MSYCPTLRGSLAVVTVCLIGAAPSGCASVESDPDGTSGAGAEGGAGGSVAGSGGFSAASGASTTGGSGGNAGAIGNAGGSVDSGGASGAAGATGTGASGGASGSAGASGSGDTAGAANVGGSGDVGGAGGLGGTDSGGAGADAGGQDAGGSGFGGATDDVGGAMGDGGDGGAGGEVNTCPEEPALTGGMMYCSNERGNAGGGYGYELWAEGTGSGCMTVYGVEATFGASWNNVDDFLARVGLDFDQTQTHTQIGTISADFAETKEDDGGLTYIGIYGWTVNPLREFYILDDWGTTKPAGTSSDGTPRTYVGTLEADGETYDVWMKTRENKPAITGDSETFDQYFSIRQTARQCGHISVSEHFKQWEELGLPLGNFHEVKLLMEAQANSGSIEFTTARVVVE